MTKSTKKAGLVVKSSVKVGGLSQNHNRQLSAAKKSGLAVKSGTKGGGLSQNHSLTALSA